MPRIAAAVALFVRANPGCGVLAIVALLCVLLAMLKSLRKRFRPHPELLRKLVHIAIGLITLSFPWLFVDPWPVIAIATISTTILTAIKIPGPLRASMGGVVDGVERKSLGDIYFPIGVATLFWLAHRSDPAVSKLLFCVPILFLALGDAVAALVGVRYGRHKFTTGEGMKSVEGSLACFAATFLSTLLPILLFTRIGQLQAVILAATVGLLATLIEAVAGDGLDNLFLPLGGYALLKTHLSMSLDLLRTDLVAVLALLAFALVWRRRTPLNDSASLGATLYAYCVWSVGGIDWLYAPIFLIVASPLVWPRTRRDAARTFTVGVVVSVGAAGLMWLFLSAAYRVQGLVFAYNVAFAAQMAMIGLARLRCRYPQTPGILLLAAAVAASWLLLIAPILFAPPLDHGPGVLAQALAAFAGILLAALLFDRLRRDLRDDPCDRARWRLQAALGVLGSAAALAPLLWGR